MCYWIKFMFCYFKVHLLVQKKLQGQLQEILPDEFQQHRSVDQPQEQ